jgi:predicted enzyme related to lactoylglutathione lyase
MKKNPVGWFEIYVKDMERARTFYEAVFADKLTPLESPDSSVAAMWAFPMEQNATGAAGALVSMQGQQPTGNGTIVYFTCEDCSVEAKRVPANGGKIMKDKFAIGQYGFIALVVDPDGNVIGLHSMK